MYKKIMELLTMQENTSKNIIDIETKIKQLNHENRMQIDNLIKLLEHEKSENNKEILVNNYSKSEKEYYKKPLEKAKNELQYNQVKTQVINKILENCLYNIMLDTLKNEKNAKVISKPVHYKVVKKLFESIFNDNNYCSIFSTGDYYSTHYFRYGIYNKNAIYCSTIYANYSDLLTNDKKYFDPEKIKAAQYKNTNCDIEKITKNIIDYNNYINDLIQETKIKRDTYLETLKDFSHIANNREVIAFYTL